MIRKKSEDAVSPVIGVMLMLVVTIVIAAVVAVFAGGLGTDVDTAPVTVVDISDISGGYTENLPVMNIKSGHKYGSDRLSYHIDGVSYLFKMDQSKVNETQPDGEEGVDYLEYQTGGWGSPTYYYILDNGFDGIKDSIFAIEGDNGLQPYGDNTELQDEFLEEGLEENSVSEQTVTINCLHGDSLDLSKISIQVTCKDRFGEYVIKTPRNTYSGTLSAGDTKKLQLADDPNLWKIYEGIEVDITIFYGDYVLVTEDKMTVSWDYR